MSILILSSYEVGGLPFSFAEKLNRNGQPTIYLSTQRAQSGHDSAAYHFKNTNKSWNLSHLLSSSKMKDEDIIEVLKRIRREHDIKWAFATGFRSYLLAAANIPYVLWIYGSDLDQQCFSPVFPENYPSWKRPFCLALFIMGTRRKMRKSIRKAKSVVIAPYQYDKLQRIAQGKKLSFFPHCIPTPPPDRIHIMRQEAQQELHSEFGCSGLLFSSTRHAWSGIWGELEDNKGNDILVKAFARYLEKAGTQDVRLVLVNKGPNVPNTKSLITKLDIENAVSWVDEMSRDELNRYYLGADLCFGQFGNPVLTFAALEPLAFGGCCASYFQRGNPATPYYDSLPPILSTRDPERLADWMATMITSSEARGLLGKEGFEWLQNHASEQAFVASFLAIGKETCE